MVHIGRFQARNAWRVALSECETRAHQLLDLDECGVWLCVVGERAADWAQEFAGQTRGAGAGIAAVTSGDVGAASWTREFSSAGNEWESEFAQLMANGDSLDSDPQVSSGFWLASVNTRRFSAVQGGLTEERRGAVPAGMGGGVPAADGAVSSQRPQ
jgi:hypothetical protein